MLVALSASPPNETSAGGDRKTPLPGGKPRAGSTGEVRIAVVGDVAIGREGVLPPDGGTTLFASAKRHLAGDVVLANLETALAGGGTSKCGVG